ncbi:MAG: apolipoprotein D and lipocalin family protein [Bacillariaceae sp.]|jgi:apolipoprotein D and lipocalin family protein
MGTWFVIAVKPTFAETTCSNAVEKYTLLDEKENNSHDIDIDFTYNPKEDPYDSKNKVKSLPQKGWIQGNDRTTSGEWKVSPLWPIKMTYPIIELDEKEYSYAVIGFPSRAYCWILSRQPVMDDKVYTDITTRLVENHQYDLNGLRMVPQQWTEDERTKRGLNDKEIPNSLLMKK